MLILGLGYTGQRLAAHLAGSGWRVIAVRRTVEENTLSFDDEGAVRDAIAQASHILSSVPPDRSTGDPVLGRYGTDIAASSAQWVAYLSSTGVYGDARGAWVDENAPIGQGRRGDRARADLGWQQMRTDVRIFRLPGIYGPGRSTLERVRARTAHRIIAPGQVFSRIHVDDIVSAIIASFDGPPGVYNIADDHPCPQNEVIEYACGLLGMPLPPLQTLDQARLSAQAHAFYTESRRIATGRARRLLSWKPRYRDYRKGLHACFAERNAAID